MKRDKFLLIPLFILILSSCFYYDTSKYLMECVGIKVYDKENNEIVGNGMNGIILNII